MAKQTVVISVLADTARATKGFARVAESVGGITGKLKGIAKVGGATLAGLAVGIGGLAIKGGIARHMKLEEAQKKLEGFGASAAEVSQISKDALASVKGTAFGLDAASTAAAAAMAAQIKPGREMERYLTSIADTAQGAGTSMEEMGSIYGKVATANRVTTQEMNQLADRGIPIWANMAKHYGVNQEELRKMVSSGQVDLENFLAVMEKTTGGVGKVMADTTSGQAKNMMAALSRVGQVVTGPIFPSFKQGLFEITKALDVFTDALAPVMDSVAAFLGPKLEAALDGLGEKVANKIVDLAGRAGELATRAMAIYSQVLSRVRTSETAQSIMSVLGDLPSKIGPLLSGLAETITTRLATVWDVIGPSLAVLGDIFTSTLMPALQGVLPAIFDLFTSLSPLGLMFSAIAPVASELGSALATVAASLGSALATILPVLTSLIGSLVSSLAPILPVIATAVGQVASLLVGALGSAIEALLPALSQIVTALADGLAAVLPALGPLLEVLVGVVVALADALAPVLPLVAELVAALVSSLAPILPVLGELLGTVAGVIGHLLVALEPLLPALVNFISAGLQVLMAILPPIIDVLVAVATVIADVLIVALSIIEPIITPIIAVIAGFAEILSGSLSFAVEAVSTLITAAWNMISAVTATTWSTISGIIKGVVGSISGAISGFTSSIIGFFSNAWTNISNGARNGMNAMKNAITSGVGSAVSTVASLPGKALSALGNIGSTLAGAGRQLIQGFIDGIKSAFGSVKETLGNLTSKLLSWKGPPKKDARLLAPAGILIIDGFIQGLESRYGAVKRSLTGLTGSLNLGPELGVADLPATGPVTINTYQVNVDVKTLDPTPEVGRKIAEAIKKWLDVNGEGR